ncbi:MAG: ATPase, T2SS/T4P/T4SS family [bacterium]
MPAVVINGGEYEDMVVEVTGGHLAIGRSLESDLILHDKNVSTHHAQIIIRDNVYWLQDLGSTNGTITKKKRIINHRLTPGDEFAITQYRLSFIESADKFSELRQASFDEVRRSLHSQLISEMNLKQISALQMADKTLRKRADEVLDRLLEQQQHDIPRDYDLAVLKKAVLDSALGLGPLESLLADPAITEIMVNTPDHIYVERKGKVQLAEMTFTGRDEIYTVIERIVGPIGRRIDESSPMVDARLPDGSRVNAVIPPLALDSPTITIRKFPSRKMSIEDLVGFGALSQSMVDFLRVCTISRKNVLISGGTGSGKTTLLNVLASFIPDGERIITIEDSAELRLPQEHVVRMETRPPNIEGKGEISIRDLVKNALRMRPDRIVVGECRGGEALDMLQAMNTGHDGSMTTAHANTPDDMLRRLETMVMMTGMELPLKAVRDLVFSAIDVILQIARMSDGTRKVVSISEVSSMYEGEIRLQEIFRFVRTGLAADGGVSGYFQATGVIPDFIEDLRQAGLGVDMEMFVPKEG